jgi:phosphatidylglycerol:prolipoprotein diacylglycerol transferase
MHPILIKLGGLTIFSYGVMLALSFIIGIYLVERRAKKIGVDPKLISDLALWTLAAVIVGSRLFYVVFHWGDYFGPGKNPIDIIAFWKGGLGGLMFFGGLLGGLLVGIWFVRRHKLPLLKMLDTISPAVALGEFLTRIGCFLNGCCFGKPTTGFCGIKFSPESAAGYTFPGVKVLPTQLFSSLAGLVLFVAVLILERKKLKPGVLFSIFLFFYAGFRFGIDFVRYYENLSNFLVNQVIALGLMVIAAVLFVILRKKGAQS